MTEAISAVNDFAFHSLGIESFFVCNVATNEASRRVKQKTGAEFVGYIELLHHNGQSRSEKWESNPRELAEAELSEPDLKTSLEGASGFAGRKLAAEAENRESQCRWSKSSLAEGWSKLSLTEGRSISEGREYRQLRCWLED